jgi:hypothetical protein
MGEPFAPISLFLLWMEVLFSSTILLDLGCLAQRGYQNLQLEAKQLPARLQ